MRCAYINTSTNIVENVIMADPDVDQVPDGFVLVALSDESPVYIGWTYDGTNFNEPS